MADQNPPDDLQQDIFELRTELLAFVVAELGNAHLSVGAASFVTQLGDRVEKAVTDALTRAHAAERERFVAELGGLLQKDIAARLGDVSKQTASAVADGPQAQLSEGIAKVIMTSEATLTALQKRVESLQAPAPSDAQDSVEAQFKTLVMAVRDALRLEMPGLLTKHAHQSGQTDQGTTDGGTTAVPITYARSRIEREGLAPDSEPAKGVEDNAGDVSTASDASAPSVGFELRLIGMGLAGLSRRPGFRLVGILVILTLLFVPTAMLIRDMVRRNQEPASDFAAPAERDGAKSTEAIPPVVPPQPAGAEHHTVSPQDVERARGALKAAEKALGVEAGATPPPGPTAQPPALRPPIASDAPTAQTKGRKDGTKSKTGSGGQAPPAASPITKTEPAQGSGSPPANATQQDAKK